MRFVHLFALALALTLGGCGLPSEYLLSADASPDSPADGAPQPDGARSDGGADAGAADREAASPYDSGTPDTFRLPDAGTDGPALSDAGADVDAAPDASSADAGAADRPPAEAATDGGSDTPAAPDSPADTAPAADTSATDAGMMAPADAGADVRADTPAPDVVEGDECHAATECGGCLAIMPARAAAGYRCGWCAGSSRCLYTTPGGGTAVESCWMGFYATMCR